MKKRYSLVEFNREFIMMVNTVSDAVILFDKEKRITLWNKSAELLTGYDSEEVLGKIITDIVDSFTTLDTKENLSKKVSEILSGLSEENPRIHLKGAIYKKDRTEILLSASLSSGEISEEWEAIIIARDITEQIKNAHEMQKLYDIVQSSNDAIVGVDLNQKITSWNPSAEAIYGYKESEVIGKNLAMIVPENWLNTISLEIEKVKSGKSLKQFEIERITKSGKKFTILLSFSPIYNEFNSVTGVSIIGRDISSEKEMMMTMVRYISEAAMRLKNPTELVLLNLSNIIQAIKEDSVNKEDLILNISIQMKNMEQIIHNLRELNQAIIGSYEEIPDEYVKYFEH